MSPSSPTRTATPSETFSLGSMQSLLNPIIPCHVLHCFYPFPIMMCECLRGAAPRLFKHLSSMAYHQEGSNLFNTCLLSE